MANAEGPLKPTCTCSSHSTQKLHIFSHYKTVTLILRIANGVGSIPPPPLSLSLSHSHSQCDDGKKEVDCSNQSGPPTLYKPGPIVITLFMMLLESIGAHGFIAFFGGLLLILGFIKLSCGGILCCRKTKQQEYAQRMVEKGVPPKSEHTLECTHFTYMKTQLCKPRALVKRGKLIHAHTYTCTCICG